MHKYLIMKNAADVVIFDANDNRTKKEYINKGYGIVDRIKLKNPLKMSVIRILKGGEKE